MKIIGISQRVDVITEYSERRDAIDQKWLQLCHETGFIPLIIPNHSQTVLALLEQIKFEGFILTGGNNLQAYEGDALERDEVELILLNFAIQNQLPLLGVCRGMQLVQSFFGIPLFKTAGHVNTEHPVFGRNQKWKVNSFHNYGTTKTSSELDVVARAEDGIIESIKHKKYPIHGIMWHPERYSPFKLRDINFVKQIFG